MLKFLKHIFNVWLPNLILVVALVLLVRFNLAPLALVLLLVSKWQILLGGPRSWWRNLRASGCEIVMAISALAALVLFNSDLVVQVITAGLYWLWLVALKPLTGNSGVAIQAGVCQFVALTMLFLLGRTIPEAAVLVTAWLVALVAADHFLSSHTEPAHNVIMFVWAMLVLQISWLLWRWLVVYALLDGRILLPQASIIITIMAYITGNIYLDHAHKKLQKRRLAEYLLIGATLLAVVIVGTNWDNRL